MGSTWVYVCGKVVLARHWLYNLLCGCVAVPAGLSRSQSSLFDGRLENWLEMISTNILGTAMMTRAALQVRSQATARVVCSHRS